MELIIYIKMDLALNNLQRLICHKTQPTDQQFNLAWVHSLIVKNISISSYSV